MKSTNIIKLLIMLVLICAIGAAFASCAKPEVTGVSFEDATVTYDGTEHALTVAGELPEGVTVTYEGNKGTDVGTYIAKATLSGEGYADTVLEATLTVEKADLAGVGIADKTVTYNGEPHSLVVVGALPADATVTYAGDGKVNVGTYEITATVTSKNYKDLTLTGTLTINKADVTGVSFDSASFVWDGEEKSVTVTEDLLPEGVTVTYENNKATSVGSYVATATLSGDNYNTVTLYASLTVTPADITGVTFADASFTYDGEPKSIAVSGLPAGATVTYTGNDCIGAGTHTVTATVKLANHNDLTLSATITISKATLSGVTLPDATFTYDGTEKKLELSGLPAGATVVWTGNSGTNAGTYPVTAVVSLPNHDAVQLSGVLKINKANVTGIGFEDATFTYDGNEKRIEITGTLPEGSSVTYSGNTATAVGTYVATVTVTCPNYNTYTDTAVLTINEPAAPELSEITGVSFEDLTVTYDGTEKKIEITGTLPAGVTVEYTNASGINADTYSAVAVLSGEGYKTKTLTATLVIEKADIDLSGVSFEDATFTYDGTEKKIEITGEDTLPVGVTASYVGNVGINATTYHAVVTFSGDNYNEASLTATMTISKASFSGISFEGATFTYDGNEKKVEITAGELPEGSSVTYSGNTDTEHGNIAIGAGIYSVTVTVECHNYQTYSKTVTLTVNRASLEGLVTLKGCTYVYNGEKHTISYSALEGLENAIGAVSVQFINNERTEIGSQTVTVIITGDNYETLTLTATLTVKSTSNNSGGLVTPPHIFG